MARSSVRITAISFHPQFNTVFWTVTGEMFPADLMAGASPRPLERFRMGSLNGVQVTPATDRFAADVEAKGELILSQGAVSLTFDFADATRSGREYSWRIGDTFSLLRAGSGGVWTITITDGIDPLAVGASPLAATAALGDAGAHLGPLPPRKAGASGLAASLSLSSAAGARLGPSSLLAGASGIAATAGAVLGPSSLLAGAQGLGATLSLPAAAGASMTTARLYAGASALRARANLAAAVGARLVGAEFQVRLGEQFWFELARVDSSTRNELELEVGDGFGRVDARVQTVDGGVFVRSQGVVYGRATRVGVYRGQLRRIDPVTETVIAVKDVEIEVLPPTDPEAWADDVRFALRIPADGDAPAWRWWTGEYQAQLEGETFEPEVLVDARVRSGIDRGFELVLSPALDTVEEAWIQTYRDLRPCELWILRRVAAGWERGRRIAGSLTAVVDNRDGTYTGRVERTDDPGARDQDFGGEYVSDESQKRLHDPEDECCGYVEQIGTEGVSAVWPQAPANV